MRISKLVTSQYLGKVLQSGVASYGIKTAGVLVAFFVLTQPTASIAQNAGRPIPSGQCAVIVMASKDTQLVLDSLRKYQDIAPTPLAIESNNGFFAAALGVFSKADGAAFIKTNLSAGRLPKDAYCGNTERYVRLIYPTADFSAFVDRPATVAAASAQTIPVAPTEAKPAAQMAEVSSPQVPTIQQGASSPQQPQQNYVAVAINPDSQGPPVVQALTTLPKVAMVPVPIETRNSIAAAEPPLAKPTPAFVNGPAEQAVFIDVVQQGQTAAKSAKNDMQKGGAKSQRDKAMCAALKGMKVVDWTGTLTEIDSNSDGKGVVEIRIAKDVHVKTWNNALSDFSANTLLQPGSDLFNKVAGFDTGIKVRFSGNFFRNNDDCLEESSLTLNGKLRDPEFIFKFSDISKL